MSRSTTDKLRARETFENIHLDLSQQSGKCRLAENGLGWRPAGGGDTFTLDRSNMTGAQWSRGSRAYELKLFTNSVGVVQLDGFPEDVRPPLAIHTHTYDYALTEALLTIPRTWTV